MKKSFITRLQPFLLSALIMLITSFLSIVKAQDVPISGKVLPSSGKSALAGVTVNVKGTERSNTADAGGAFTITTPKVGNLVFNYSGFLDKEIPGKVL